MFVICALASLILYFISILGDYNLSSGVILVPLAAYFAYGYYYSWYCI